MAESIGGKIRNVLVGILIAFLVLAFAVWGVNDMFTPGARNAVATVGDAEVSTEEFDALFTREVERLNRDRTETITNEQAYAQGVHNQVLQNMITNKVVEIDADDLGVGVNRRNAREEIASIEAFQNELTGKFDEAKLNQALNRARITRRQFEADTLQSLRSQQTIPAITGGLVAPADYATMRYKFLTEQRRASVLTLNTNSIEEPETPTDEVLQDYVNNNAARFMAPEYRKFVMIRVEPFDFIPDLTRTEEDIKDFPESTREELLDLDSLVKDAFDYQVETGAIGSPETRSIVIVSSPDEETANKAVDALKAGDDPILVANLLGLGSPITYDSVKKNGLVDAESSKAAFDLERGDVRAVLTGLGSWEVILVRDITKAVVPSLRESEDEIRETLLNDLAKESIYDVTAEIEDAMIEGLTLEEIAETVGVPLSAYEFVDRSGITPSEVRMSGFTGIPGIASDDIILRTLFTSDLGFETDFFETSTGGFATLRVDDIIDSKMRPFEDVREEALQAYLYNERTERLREKALEITQRARAGENLSELKAELGDGATLEEIPLIRTNPPQGLGGEITVALFNAEEDDVVRGAGRLPLTEQIATLDRIIASQDGLAGTYLEVVQSQVSAAISSDIQNAYQQAVIAENPVQQYPEKIRSTLGLDQNN